MTKCCLIPNGRKIVFKFLLPLEISHVKMPHPTWLRVFVGFYLEEST